MDTLLLLGKYTLYGILLLYTLLRFTSVKSGSLNPYTELVYLLYTTSGLFGLVFGTLSDGLNPQ